MNRSYAALIAIWSLFLFAVLLSLSETAQCAVCKQWAGKVASVQGVVESLAVGETAWQPVKLNDTLCPGDQVRVMENSRADIALANDAVMRLDENSSLTLEGTAEQKTSVIDLVKGAGHFFSRRPNSLEVNTPYTIAGIRGTEFLIGVEKNRTTLTIFNGTVLARNDQGSLELRSGQSAVAEAGKAPVLTVVVRPRDAVQWALYYPPIIYAAPEKVPPGGKAEDARLYAQRASDLLAVGRVEQASAEIRRALDIDPKFDDAYALQSILAVVQNDKEKALGLARRAVETAPESASGYLALSYALQAGFDVEGARKSLEEAVKAEPGNALAWARLSEAWSMSGNLDRSLRAAEKAVSIDPQVSRTQMVLGFAYLMQTKTDKARKAFERAVELDQADPMPRLGLGLAIIRDGHLQEGGKQLEIAASLDPNNSLIRSYLGKVYYEEKRTGLDEREYETAKQLDPKDPTPWFYEAITKETTNRPVEALQDVQKAIELNDNRAVYRSKLLLDSDEAARSASLAYIYNDLGFQQRALAEGWNSVNLDPTNYSAHRFLSDSYSALPRHEIARVSELLQAQLLQPLNINPIQAQLADSSLFLLSSLGPSAASFNEFNPLLFSRNRIAFTTSGLAGEHDTAGGEGIVSAIYDQFSINGAFAHFETDGWRANAGETNNIGDFFAQYALSPKTNFQFEFKHKEVTMGDTVLRFFTDDLYTNLRYTQDTDIYRFGFHEAFSPGSHLLINIMHADSNPRVDTIIPQYSFWNYNDLQLIEGNSGELQYLYRSDRFNITAGGGYFKTAIDETNVNTIFGFIYPPALDTITTDHGDLYLYSNVFLPCNFTLTAGVSGDFFNQETKTPYSVFWGPGGDQKLKRDLLNPKAGLTWTLFPGTTLRAAAFSALKRTLITNQTLEPTQVAGFNQFFDDVNGTKAWTYGAGVDQKFCETVFGGAEFYYRDLSVPWSMDSPPVLQPDALWKEYIGRGYLYWTPHKWVSVTAEYWYEKYRRVAEFNAGIKDVETHRLPLAIHFFHPSGWSFMLRGTYYNQDGSFNKLAAPAEVFLSGTDGFWLLDAAISYRLPKRYGIITLGVANLLDQRFQYADSDAVTMFVQNNATIEPSRTVFGKITFEFP
ncbi:MAG TPA: FecR domain-containing protein [Syntrophobacteraceae bacterium]|nr:FecR domain-containing protein [Syntrophobacteraceae bacterium]